MCASYAASLPRLSPKGCLLRDTLSSPTRSAHYGRTITRGSHRLHSIHNGGRGRHIHNQWHGLESHRHFLRRDSSSILGKASAHFHGIACAHFHPTSHTNSLIPDSLPQSVHGRSSWQYA